MNLKNICLPLLFLFTSIQLKAQFSDHESVTYRKPLFDFEYSKSVFKLSEDQQKNKNKFLRFSVFTGYREGVEPVKRDYGFNLAVAVDESRGTIHQQMYNASIEEMLTHGFSFIKRSHVLLEVKDPSKYRYTPDLGPKLEWMRKNTYCYELMLPISVFNDVKIVDNDVARHFGLSYTRETREVKTLVLVKGPLEYTINNNSKSEISTAVTLAKFEDLLNDAGKHILINRTGEEDPLVNLGLSADQLPLTNLPMLRKVIQKYGLDLKEENMKIKFYVIKEVR